MNESIIQIMNRNEAKGASAMTDNKKAEIILEALGELFPVNYNLESLWLAAIRTGLRRIREAEEYRAGKS
jgi:hypothetical protein